MLTAQRTDIFWCQSNLIIYYDFQCKLFLKTSNASQKNLEKLLELKHFLRACFQDYIPLCHWVFGRRFVFTQLTNHEIQPILQSQPYQTLINISNSLDCYERHTIPVRVILHFPLARGGSFCRTVYSESMKTVMIKFFAPRLVKTKDWNTQIAGLTLLWLHLRKSCCFQECLGSSLFLLAYLSICAFTCTKKSNSIN